jgi:hypothetical protein
VIGLVYKRLLAYIILKDANYAQDLDIKLHFN